MTRKLKRKISLALTQEGIEHCPEIEIRPFPWLLNRLKSALGFSMTRKFKRKISLIPGQSRSRKRLMAIARGA